MVKTTLTQHCTVQPLSYNLFGHVIYHLYVFNVNKYNMKNKLIRELSTITAGGRGVD